MAAVAEVYYQKTNIHWFSYWPSVVTVCPIKYHHLKKVKRSTDSS